MVIPIINKVTRTVIGQARTNRSLTLDECIECIGGEIINDKDDPRWSRDGNNVIIGDKRYRYEDLV